MPFVGTALRLGRTLRHRLVYDAQMQLTEHGVAPTPGAEIDMEPQLALDGTDTILEFAIDVLNRIAEENRLQESPCALSRTEAWQRTIRTRHAIAPRLHRENTFNRVWSVRMTRTHA